MLHSRCWALLRHGGGFVPGCARAGPWQAQRLKRTDVLRPTWPTPPRLGVAAALAGAAAMPGGVATASLSQRPPGCGCKLGSRAKAVRAKERSAYVAAALFPSAQREAVRVAFGRSDSGRSMLFVDGEVADNLHQSRRGAGQSDLHCRGLASHACAQALGLKECKRWAGPGNSAPLDFATTANTIGVASMWAQQPDDNTAGVLNDALRDSNMLLGVRCRIEATTSAFLF